MKYSIPIRVLPIVLLLLGLSSCEKEYLNPQENLKLSNPVSGPKVKMDLASPTITCGSATEVSINIMVTAGANGAPAGFSIQWVPKWVLADNGGIWDGLSDPTNQYNPYYCHASFSGNANLSRYNLRAGEDVIVNIGELLFDNGASTNCDGALECGEEYAFRAFAHANSSYNRSAFTTTLCCSTLPCNNGPGCTYTQGYWKTHGPIPTGNNTNEWPVNNLTLGSVNYTDLQLQAILDKQAAGNGLIALAHQLIAAKLNVENGADPTDAAAAIAAADALIGGLIVPPVGAGSLAPSATSSLIATLTAYNEGSTGPGHCN